MGRGLEPTEEYDSSVTVHVLHDMDDDETIQCSSYRDAIQAVKLKRESATAVKIVDRNGEIVFTSDGMNLEDWVAEWESAKRSLSIDVESHECPYDNLACVADDLCPKCHMDKLRDQN